MRKSRTDLGIGAVLAFWCAWILLAGTSSANLTIQKKAKEAGFPAANCQYCHIEKLPKKDAVSHNERGIWLKAEKDQAQRQGSRSGVAQGLSGRQEVNLRRDP